MRWKVSMINPILLQTFYNLIDCGSILLNLLNSIICLQAENLAILGSYLQFQLCFTTLSWILFNTLPNNILTNLAIFSFEAYILIKLALKFHEQRVQSFINFINFRIKSWWKEESFELWLCLFNGFVKNRWLLTI